MSSARVNRRVQAVAIAAVGFVIVLAYAAWAAIQIVWLNPLAAAPGRSLQQITQDMAAAGEYSHTSTVVVVMSAGPLIALTLLVATIMVRRPDPWLTALLYLSLLTFGPGAYFIASFGTGMALADTYSIGGGDYSPWARPLYLLSLLALIALIVLAVVGVRKGWPSHPPARGSLDS